MIFLLLEMFVYLVLAGGIGAGAGWLLRNLQAQKVEEAAQRAAHDAKAKLPQLESMVRSRDEQLAKVKLQFNEAKTELKQRDKSVHELEKQLRDLDREAKRWQQTAKARQAGGGDDLQLLDGLADVAPDATDSAATDTGTAAAEVAQLRQRLAASEQQLSELQVQLVEAQQNESDHSEESVLQIELDAARAEVTQLQRRLDDARQALSAEQDKVVELEREQELQNKSLMVLHQQLELERNRRAAAG